MHEKNREYNGYSNYETWNYMLWAGNDEPCYKLVQEAVKRCKKLGGDAHDLATELRDITQDQAPELKTSFYSDVMMASVNTYLKSSNQPRSEIIGAGIFRGSLALTN